MFNQIHEMKMRKIKESRFGDVESRYREFKRLRVQGFNIKESSKKLGVTIQTGCRYEKRYRTERLPAVIDELKQRLVNAVVDKDSTADDIAKLADALSKLQAVWWKI